ncbi:MAG: glycosyltransferase [Verrucomicrobiales bacterium]|nr:glycosyltransferase [Verrucomicrobiales bacterium]
MADPNLLFISNLFPARESAYNGLDNAFLLHHLRADFDIRLLCPKPVFPPGKELNLSPRKVDLPLNPIYIPVPYLPKIGSRWNDKLMRRGLRPAFEKLIRQWKPDSILCSWLYPDACAVSILAQEQSIPCDLITQGSDTHQYLKNPIRRQRIIEAIKRSRHVICRSGDLGKQLAEAGADKQQLHTVYNGIDPQIFHAQKNEKSEVRQKLKLPKKTPILLFVGNFLPVKNPLFLLEAFASLRSTSHPNAHLVMIGKGSMREALEQKTASLGLQQVVTFTGARNSTEVADYMNAADLFCLCSHYEGLPNVILESLACGLPVVSTNVGGIGEVLNLDEYGSLIPPNTPTSLTEYVNAIRKHLENPSQRQKIENYGKQFTWQKSADRYRELILG